MLFEYLKALKTKKNLTAQYISEKSGISVSNISRIFNGENDNPSWNTIVPIFKAMGGSLDIAAGIQNQDLADANSLVIALQQRNVDLKETITEQKENIVFYKDRLSSEREALAVERAENRTLRRVIIALVMALVVFAAFSIYIVADAFNGSWGIIRY